MLCLLLINVQYIAAMLVFFTNVRLLSLVPSSSSKILILMPCSRKPGASLEQTHVFVLAHILRRPIIVYGVKYYKSFRGETLGYTRFQGELEK